MINSAILYQLAPSLTKAQCDVYAPLLEEICPLYGINTADIFHEFIANVLEETGEFQRLNENLNYKADTLKTTFGRHRISIDDCDRYGRTVEHKANPIAIANILYGGNWGFQNLGNRIIVGQSVTDPNGDGWVFKGGGLLQLTGRAWFTKFATFFNGKFATNYTAEQISVLVRTDMKTAIHSACWVFAVADSLIDEAITDDMKKIVKTINGGYLNMDKRMYYYNKAIQLIK